MRQFIILFYLFIFCQSSFALSKDYNKEKVSKVSNLNYESLAQSWDEALPLGNGFVGALIWEKENNLRLSLDRIDLWDLRPMENLKGEFYSYDWICKQVSTGDCNLVWKMFDDPYSLQAAPSKIPGAGLEFPIESLGEVEKAELNLQDASAIVKWKNGTEFRSFVHADQPCGHFVFTDLNEDIIPILTMPAYRNSTEVEKVNSHAGPELERLGYEQGALEKKEWKEGKKSHGQITYHQKGWGNFYYDVTVRYVRDGGKLYGTWSVTSSLCDDKATDVANKEFKKGYNNGFSSHKKWWNNFWSKSSVNLPDNVLQHQYDNEVYKFGSLARENGYIIPLQGVWTADNGKLPPWKGDIHHDLNTELSYWPAYKGNYLVEGYGFLHTLLNQRETNRKFAKDFYGCDGLNVPGVASLTGEPLGGWAQYSLSPTTAAWLSQHFYLHWRYGADRQWLKEVGYPYVKEVATFLEQVSKLVETEDGVIRKLPYSTSPEIHDNSLKAWFPTMTNYDLALMKAAFGYAAEMAQELKLYDQASAWSKVRRQLQDFILDENNALAFAKDEPYRSSHRHLSNAMAIHPLGLIDVANNQREKDIIEATIKTIDKHGSNYWVGYSFSWLANMKARAYDGDGAAEALKTFANYFCLSNTFHANGDQKKSGRSLFTYRPVTLEGNFAFASGIQEMLMQCHRGYIEIFPAIPSTWKEVSFSTLRSEGAILVSATREDGETTLVELMPENGGTIKIKNPFSGKYKVVGKCKAVIKGEIIEISNYTPGKAISLKVEK